MARDCNACGHALGAHDDEGVCSLCGDNDVCGGFSANYDPRPEHQVCTICHDPDCDGDHDEPMDGPGTVTVFRGRRVDGPRGDY